MTRSIKELEEGAHHVKGEWTEVAQMASLLPQCGDRALAETAALEATLVHTRCLIHFCCGGYEGRRDDRDIVPADFLGVDWWPRDEDFDRHLRGRLGFIDRELQHLSWQRVLNKKPLIVPIVLVAYEVHWGMHLFVDELRAKQSDCRHLRVPGAARPEAAAAAREARRRDEAAAGARTAEPRPSIDPGTASRPPVERQQGKP